MSRTDKDDAQPSLPSSIGEQSSQPKPSFLVTRPVSIYDEAICDASETSPIWYQKYTCSSCPDSSFCTRCAAALPHESAHMFYASPGRVVDVDILSSDLLTQVWNSIAEDGPIKAELERISESDVMMADAEKSEEELEADNEEATEESMYGTEGHPFLHLIPEGLSSLSKESTTLNNLDTLVESCPWLRDLAPAGQYDPLLPRKNMELSSLIGVAEEICMEHTPEAPFIHFATYILDCLEIPPAYEKASLAQRKSLSVLPDFLKTETGVPDHPAPDGVDFLLCAWFWKQRETLNETDFPIQLLQAVEDLYMNYVEDREETMSLNSFEMTGFSTVYCVPLLEMRKLKKPCRQQMCTALNSELSVRNRIPVFVSHAWSTAEHPDPRGEDWKQIQDFLWKTIAAVVTSISLFLRLGISKAVIEEAVYRGSPAPTKHPTGGLVGQDFCHEIVKCALEEATDFCHCTNRSNVQWCFRVAEHVQIWFDFVSLPQWPRTDEEEILFRATLSDLAGLQRQMHTLTIEPESGYLKRAWCVAEWLVGDQISTPTFFDGEDDMHGDVLPLGLQRIVKQLDSFHTLMRQDLGSTEEVLEALNLRITNGRSDSPIVCKILWESPRTVAEKIWLCDSGHESVVVASGSLQNVCERMEHIYRYGFTSNLFASFPAVAGRDAKLGSKAKLTVYWLLHDGLKKEEQAKILRRDLGALYVILRAFTESETLSKADITWHAGLTCTTKVKQEPGVILCGFSCDEAVCGIGDIVVPIQGSVAQQKVFTRMLDYQRSMRRWLEHGEDSDAEDESSQGNKLQQLRDRVNLV